MQLTHGASSPVLWRRGGGGGGAVAGGVGDAEGRDGDLHSGGSEGLSLSHSALQSSLKAVPLLSLPHLNAPPLHGQPPASLLVGPQPRSTSESTGKMSILYMRSQIDIYAHLYLVPSFGSTRLASPI